jgi:hypothetical protein
MALDSEFDAVTDALREYRTAIIARAETTDFQGHINADKSVIKAHRKLEQSFKDLRFAERCEYDAERRGILGIPLEKDPGDDIPF